MPDYSQPANRTTATRAIRLKCRQCCPGSYREIERCELTICPLWPHRFGIRPQTALKRSKRVATGGVSDEKAAVAGQAGGEGT